jgi:DNA-binding response OmpR family regulator
VSRPLILISEDDKLLLAMLQERFTRAGFDLILDSESRAFELAREAQPHLALLDSVQKIGGLQILTWFKNEPATQDIPVVVMTATPSDKDRLFCLELGAAGYAGKPLDEAAVMRFARLAVESAERRALNEIAMPVAASTRPGSR